MSNISLAGSENEGLGARPSDPWNGLPPADTKRWVVSRKAQVVRAVEQGLVSLEAACARYNLSREEFAHWCQLIQAHGTRALRATRVQDYRGATRRTRGRAR